MIQQGFVTPWSIFTPTAYRLLPREFVEAFFATGELQLSSFTAFARHPDEAPRDTKEGHNVIVGRGPNTTTFASVVHGDDAYVLSATACAPSNELLTRFGASAAIQIFDTTGFASAVAKHVPGMRFGFEGFCFYTDGAIEYKVPDVDLEAYKTGIANTLDMGKVMGKLQNIAGNAVYFRKRVRYSAELEYRWIWIAANPPEKLLVRVPEARNYCLPWYQNDVGKGDPADESRPAGLAHS
jgi:hypothetical protein